MSTNDKYILVDGKYLLNADHVESVGSMHTVQELGDKSDAPSGATDLTNNNITDQSYQAATDVSIYEAAGSLTLNMSGREIMADITDNADRQGIKAAITDSSIMFSWVNE